ncbi:MAG: precorrin-6Y C5,15-methyltransferase (decarboxylating) subunit CbiT [Coriobacteriia bacterium]|nr:precorrin-6Y C5,15-methyltransferase (decarboxylating) subunit CbiT [Coriobacteriia bacterium]
MDDRFAFGVPDDAFERAGGVPMSKREVRAVTLSYAQVSHDGLVLEVGAGTGALTADIARLCAHGRVVAIERSPEAFALLSRNTARLAPANVECIEGEAPDAFEALKTVLMPEMVPVADADAPPRAAARKQPTTQTTQTLACPRFDVAIVGGHGGRLAEILAALPTLLAPGGRVVVNAVGLSVAMCAFEAFAAAPWAGREMVQVSISRAGLLGCDVRLTPLNPVFVVSACCSAPGMSEPDPATPDLPTPGMSRPDQASPGPTGSKEDA